MPTLAERFKMLEQGPVEQGVKRITLADRFNEIKSKTQIAPQPVERQPMGPQPAMEDALAGLRSQIGQPQLTTADPQSIDRPVITNQDIINNLNPGGVMRAMNPEEEAENTPAAIWDKQVQAAKIPRTAGEEAVNAIRRGTASTITSATGAAANVARLLPSQMEPVARTLEQFGNNLNQGVAEDNPSSVNRIEDVKTTKDFVNWAISRGGEQVPIFMAMAIAGNANPVLAPVAMEIGSIHNDVSAELASKGMEPTKAQSLVNATLGTAAGLLDAASFNRFMNNLKIPGNRTKFSEYLLNAPKEVAIQGMVEGSTEGAQSVIERSARVLAIPEKGGFIEQMTSPEAISEFTNSAAAGGLVGAASGGMAGTIQAMRAPKIGPQLNPSQTTDQPQNAQPSTPQSPAITPEQEKAAADAETQRNQTVETKVADAFGKMTDEELGILAQGGDTQAAAEIQKRKPAMPDESMVKMAVALADDSGKSVWVGRKAGQIVLSRGPEDGFVEVKPMPNEGMANTPAKSDSQAKVMIDEQKAGSVPVETGSPQLPINSGVLPNGKETSSQETRIGQETGPDQKDLQGQVTDNQQNSGAVERDIRRQPVSPAPLVTPTQSSTQPVIPQSVTEKPVEPVEMESSKPASQPGVEVVPPPADSPAGDDIQLISEAKAALKSGRGGKLKKSLLKSAIDSYENGTGSIEAVSERLSRFNADADKMSAEIEERSNSEYDRLNKIYDTPEKKKARIKQIEEELSKDKDLKSVTFSGQRDWRGEWSDEKMRLEELLNQQSTVEPAPVETQAPAAQPLPDKAGEKAGLVAEGNKADASSAVPPTSVTGLPLKQVLAASDESSAQTADQAANGTIPQNQDEVKPGGINETQGADNNGLTENKADLFGSQNKIFTKERADKARETIRRKLGGTQLNSGIDPETIQAGLELAGYYIEGGARKFADFSAKMMDDMGEQIKPYLKSWYLAAKNHPGFDGKDMDNESGIDSVLSGKVRPERIKTDIYIPVPKDGQGSESFWKKIVTETKKMINDYPPYQQMYQQVRTVLESFDTKGLKLVIDSQSIGDIRESEHRSRFILPQNVGKTTSATQPWDIWLEGVKDQFPGLVGRDENTIDAVLRIFDFVEANKKTAGKYGYSPNILDQVAARDPYAELLQTRLERAQEGQQAADEINKELFELAEIYKMNLSVPAGMAEPAESKPEGETSARQADMAEDRAAMGLDVIDSKERRTWKEVIDKAKDNGTPEYAQQIAADILENPRPLTDEETAGLVVAAARLKNQHAEAMRELHEARDEADIRFKSALVNRIELEFDALSRAIHASGTEKGRALAAQKLTVDRDYSLVSIKTRAKAAKGKTLTVTEAQNFEKLSGQLEEAIDKIDAMAKEIQDLKAAKFVKEGVAKRYKNMTKNDKDAELKQLADRTRELLKAGCY